MQLHSQDQDALYARGMPISSRIREARKRADFSQARLGDALGVSGQAVSQWERGENDPELPKLKKMARALNTTVGWLCGDEEDPGQHPSEFTTDSEPVGPGIREIDIRAGMGGGGIESRVTLRNGIYHDAVKAEKWQFPQSFLAQEVRAPEDRLIIAEAQGDSMSPTITSGERVLVDTGHRVPSPDGIYALRDRFGALVVKRLQVLRTGDTPRVLVISDNQHHPQEDVGLDEIEIVGRVLMGFRRF